MIDRQISAVYILIRSGQGQCDRDRNTQSNWPLKSRLSIVRSRKKKVIRCSSSQHATHRMPNDGMFGKSLNDNIIKLSPIRKKTNIFTDNKMLVSANCPL